MNCPQTKSRLIDLLYNELDDPTAASVRRHLESCPRCAAERAALERTRDALDAWTPAESLADPCLEATPAAARVRAGRRSILHRAGPWLGGLAAGIVLLVGLRVLTADGRAAQQEARIVRLARTEIARERIFTLEALEGRLDEWQVSQDRVFAALLHAIEAGRIEDRQQFAQVVEAVARGAAQETQRTRGVVDDLVRLVALDLNSPLHARTFRNTETLP